jgi:hypothetical protein
MKKFKQILKGFQKKHIVLGDIIFILILLVAGMFYTTNNYRFDVGYESSLELINPWIVVKDQGDYKYVLDNERTRIVKLNPDHQVEQGINGYAPDGNTFYYADNMTVGENGDIYVLETGWSLTGFSVEYESIIRYDASGEFKDFYYEVFYDEIYND